jgi:hypothetical protein
LGEIEGALQVSIGQRALGLSEKGARVFERLVVAGGEAEAFELARPLTEALLEVKDLAAEGHLLRGSFASLEGRHLRRRRSRLFWFRRRLL